jgi:hypothetical protein
VLERAFGARAVEGRVRERQLMGIGDPELGTASSIIIWLRSMPTTRPVGATRAASARTSSPTPQPTSRMWRPGAGSNRS